MDIKPHTNKRNRAVVTVDNGDEATMLSLGMNPQSDSWKNMFETLVLDYKTRTSLEEIGNFPEDVVMTHRQLRNIHSNLLRRLPRRPKQESRSSLVRQMILVTGNIGNFLEAHTGQRTNI